MASTDGDVDIDDVFHVVKAILVPFLNLVTLLVTVDVPEMRLGKGASA